MKSKEKISVNKEGIEHLCSVFNVTKASVWAALAYQTNSTLAKKIRYTALKKKADGGCGGQLWRVVDLNE